MYRIVLFAAFALAVPTVAAAQPAPPSPTDAEADAEADVEAGAEAGVELTVPSSVPPVDDAEVELAPVADEAPPPPPVAYHSSFMDTRLNFTFTNEDVLASADEPHVPNVPGTRFGRPNSLGTLFFDNYDTRFSGFETLTHAVLYKKESVQQWDFEGALVLRMNDLSERDIRLSDAGSYIVATYWLDPSRQSYDRVTVTAFPTSSDRFRLGYSYRLSWGGSDEYRRSDSEVPGVKLQYETENAYAFVGAKSALLLDRTVNEERAVLAGLAGAGVHIGDLLRIEANGGIFDRGTNEQQDVLEEHVYLYGGSVQVAIENGMALGSSVDYRLYRNSPESVAHFFSTAKYPGGVSWLIASEATLLAQTLKDPQRSGSTVTQYGAAGDMQARVQIDYTRLWFTLQYRDLAFILHSTPSIPSYTDFPEEYETAPNFFAALGADHYFPASKLTLGATVGVDRPSSLTTPKAIPGDMTLGASTVVVRDEGDLTILPPGEEVVVQVAAKLSGRVDLGNHFATILDVYYSRDPNRTRLSRSGPDDLLEYEFDDFDRLGFNLNLQARF